MVRFPVIESVDQEGSSSASGSSIVAATNGYFYPESYGAIGDGVADDSIALNACIAAAESYGTGASVILTKQTYAHAAPLAVLTAAGLKIMGVGSRLQWTEGPTLKFTGGQGTGALCTLQSSMTATVPTTGGTITTSGPAPAALGDGNFTIFIDSEILWVYSGAKTTTWTVRRGLKGTTAAIHAIGASITPAYGAVMVGSPAGFTMENLRVQYSNAAFTGDLIDLDWYPPNFSDPTNWEFQGCAIRGTPSPSTAASARSLIRLNHAIIGRIEACHFGERNGPAIRCGETDYCVAVQIRDNTYNSGAAGTYCVETTGGCEAILIEGNTFEAVGGNFKGAWRHLPGTAWHISFRENWMGDQGSNLYQWVDIQGQLNSFEISNNRFTSSSFTDVMINFEASSTLNGGMVTGNHMDNAVITCTSTIIRSVWTVGNYAFSTAQVAYGSVFEGANGLLCYPSSATPFVGIGITSAVYPLDIADVSAIAHKGARLQGGAQLWFGGTSGNTDAVLRFSNGEAGALALGAATANACGGLIVGTTNSENSPASYSAGQGLLYVYDDASGTVRWKVSTHGSTVSQSQSFLGHYLVGTATWNPASVASGAITTTTITVTNAAVGQPVAIGFPLLVAGVAATAGLSLTGQVTAANTVTVVLRNDTGGAVDLDSGTLEALVWQH